MVWRETPVWCCLAQLYSVLGSTDKKVSWASSPQRASIFFVCLFLVDVSRFPPVGLLWAGIIQLQYHNFIPVDPVCLSPIWFLLLWHRLSLC